MSVIKPKVSRFQILLVKHTSKTSTAIMKLDLCSELHNIWSG